MALITIPKPADKDVEYSNLSTHVMLSHERYQALNARICKLEDEYEKVKSQVRSNKQYILGATATVLAGIFSTIVALIIRFPRG